MDVGNQWNHICKVLHGWIRGMQRAIMSKWIENYVDECKWGLTVENRKMITNWGVAKRMELKY